MNMSPIRDMDGQYPVVLYFGTKAEAHEFVEMVKDAKPELKEVEYPKQ